MRQTLIGLLVLTACASTNGGASLDGGGELSDAGTLDAPWPEIFDATPPIDAGPPAPDADLSCPPYQHRCGGVCIPTSTDPDNCGGCGVECTAEQVCSAGGCRDGCLPGLSECSQRCVDIDSDSDNCGSCGHVCPAGQGCTERTCVPAIGTDDLPMCVNGGPPPDLGDGMSGGCVAQTTFLWAICSCQDIDVSATLKTDAFDSAAGPYMPGGVGGAIGMNEKFKASGKATVGGTMWASSPGGANPSSEVSVAQNLYIGGPFSPKTFSVAGQAVVDGNVSTSGSIVFDSTLFQETGTTVSGNVSYAMRVEQPISVPTPCECAPGDILPIASLVSAAASNNDNALIGLQPNALSNPGSAVHLDLPCGRYYVTGISGSKSITIVAHGHTVLFVDGNVGVSNPLVFTLDDDATLDVLISGNLGGSGGLTVGSPNYPALTRFYIGGTNGFSISSGATLGAFFYAPNGLVNSSAPLEVYGGVFAGNFHNSGTTSIHYDKAVLAAGDDCGMDECGSCQDCGNQACIEGECSACTDSSQCCAPLECNTTTGVCVPIID